MSLQEPSHRRVRPVRLSDVPIALRLKAAQREARHSPEMAQELLAAALLPSSRTYYIADERLAA